MRLGSFDTPTTATPRGLRKRERSVRESARSTMVRLAGCVVVMATWYASIGTVKRADERYEKVSYHAAIFLFPSGQLNRAVLPMKFLGQRPRNLGGRFSLNASTPSLWSWVSRTAPEASVSISISCSRVGTYMEWNIFLASASA